jgi:triosephosphate isomerase (TIM)
MRATWVMGNWKMHGTKTTVTQLLHTLRSSFPQTQANCVVFPPSIYLPLAASLLSDGPIAWGAQNMFPKDSGPYTGEHAPLMLLDYGCQYVLVGHSERRQYFNESEKFVAEKFHQAKEHDMIPVLCVGETLEEREQGLTEQVLERQIRAVFSNSETDFKRCIIAYEPVWAIGTGKTATPEQAEEVHVFIRNFIAQVNHQDALALSIVYGGSVNEKNAQALFSMPNIDGGLVGGASLQAESFFVILKCTNY